MIRIPRLLCHLSLLALLGQATTAKAQTLDEIAIDLINPVSSLGTMINDFNYTTFQGDLPESDDQDRWEYNITPSIPFPLSNGKTIVLRFTFPINLGEPTYLADGQEYAAWRIRQDADVIPADGAFFSGHSFLDDLSFDLSYGGTRDDGFISMYGIKVVMPTSRDASIERDQWLLGPEVAFGKITDWGIYGVKASHLTNVADLNKEDRGYDFNTNITSLKIFFAYGLGNGWQVISNPDIQYDWEGAGSNKLALPLGIGIAKTTRLGKIPFKVSAEIQNYLASPDAFGPQWQLKLNITPVIWDRSR